MAWSIYKNFGLFKKYVLILAFPPLLLCLTLFCRPVTRWPRTLAGITAYLQCTRNTHGSGIYPGNPQDERKAWRRCDRGGFWADDDYSRCQYANDVTRVLYMFNQVTRRSSDLLRLSTKHGIQTRYERSFLKYLSSIQIWCLYFAWWICLRNKFWSSQMVFMALSGAPLPCHCLALCLCLNTCVICIHQTKSRPSFTSTWELPRGLLFMIPLS